MKRRRRKIDQDDDGLSPAERVCALLRDVQWQTNCSTKTLQSVLDSLHGKLGEAIYENAKSRAQDFPEISNAQTAKCGTRYVCVV